MKWNSYPTDLTDAQWRRIAPWVPEPKPGGRPASYARREIINAILYLTRNGCTWRALPHDFPPYRIVFHYFRLWQQDGTWERIHAKLRERVRGLGAALTDAATFLHRAQKWSEPRVMVDAEARARRALAGGEDKS